jgi:hypothetical protein
LTANRNLKNFFIWAHDFILAYEFRVKSTSRYNAIFKGPFIDESSDEEVASAGAEPTTAQDATEGASTSAPTDQTTSTAPSAPDDPPLQLATRTTRPPVLLANLSSQIMTEEEIAEAQAGIQASQIHYEPSHAADTVHPVHPIQLNGFQSSNATTPSTRAASTPDPRAPTRSSNWRSTVPDLETIAGFAPLRPPPPIMTEAEIETLLAPVKTELEKLKGTRMPPDNGRVAGKTAMQVLRDRLLPIGRYIMQILDNIEEHRRGATETEVCRYIAEHYSPQDLTPVDGLGITEIYRNTIYLEKTRYEQWLAEVEEESRRVKAEEEEEARRPEALEDRFVDESEEVPRLVDGDVWRAPGEERFRPVPLLGKVIPGLESDGTDDEGDVGMADSCSWWDGVRWPWGQPEGG